MNGDRPSDSFSRPIKLEKKLRPRAGFTSAGRAARAQLINEVQARKGAPSRLEAAHPFSIVYGADFSEAERLAAQRAKEARQQVTWRDLMIARVNAKPLLRPGSVCLIAALVGLIACNGTERNEEPITIKAWQGAPPGKATPSAWTRVDVRQLAAQAQLIFAGQVERVSYRMSDSLPEGAPSIPHTFVTFRIHRVLHGRPESRERITLRFVGGVRPDSTVLMASNVPLFDVGDRDILFVTGNGLRLSPLVEGTGGRFRVIDDRVYTDGGREVWMANPDSLILGSLRALEKVLTHQAGPHVFRQRVSSLEGENGAPPASVSPPGKPLSGTAFVALLDRVVANLFSAKTRLQLPVVRSAGVTDSLVVRLRPRLPPER